MKKLILSMMLLAFATVAMSTNTSATMTSKSLSIEVLLTMENSVCPICDDLYQRLDNLSPSVRNYIYNKIARLKAYFKAHPEIKNQHEKLHKWILFWVRNAERGGR
jgi:thioredoxin-related protein